MDDDRKRVLKLLEVFFQKKGIYDHYAFQDAEEMLYRAYKLNEGKNAKRHMANKRHPF